MCSHSLTDSVILTIFLLFLFTFYLIHIGLLTFPEGAANSSILTLLYSFFCLVFFFCLQPLEWLAVRSCQKKLNVLVPSVQTIPMQVCAQSCCLWWAAVFMPVLQSSWVQRHQTCKTPCVCKAAGNAQVLQLYRQNKFRLTRSSLCQDCRSQGRHLYPEWDTWGDQLDWESSLLDKLHCC